MCVRRYTANPDNVINDTRGWGESLGMIAATFVLIVILELFIEMLVCIFACFAQCCCPRRRITKTEHRRRFLAAFVFAAASVAGLAVGIKNDLNLSSEGAQQLVSTMRDMQNYQNDLRDLAGDARQVAINGEILSNSLIFSVPPFEDQRVNVSLKQVCT